MGNLSFIQQTPEFSRPLLVRVKGVGLPRWRRRFKAKGGAAEDFTWVVGVWLILGDERAAG
jgi:hypothetical protein